MGRELWNWPQAPLPYTTAMTRNWGTYWKPSFPDNWSKFKWLSEHMRNWGTYWKPPFPNLEHKSSWETDEKSFPDTTYVYHSSLKYLSLKLSCPFSCSCSLSCTTWCSETCLSWRRSLCSLQERHFSMVMSRLPTCRCRGCMLLDTRHMHGCLGSDNNLNKMHRQEHKYHLQEKHNLQGTGPLQVTRPLCTYSILTTGTQYTSLPPTTRNWAANFTKSTKSSESL